MEKENPLRIKDPEFVCCAPQEYALEAEVAISDSKSGYKSDRFSTVSFRTDQMGGYTMRVALRFEGEKEWHVQEDLGGVCIQIAGDFEANILEDFFRHVGLMLTVRYGAYKPHTEEEQ